jgi:hypothetical protein
VPGFRTDSDPFALSVTSVSSALDDVLRAKLLAELHDVASSLSNPLLVADA